MEQQTKTECEKADIMMKAFALEDKGKNEEADIIRDNDLVLIVMIIISINFYVEVLV